MVRPLIKVILGLFVAVALMAAYVPGAGVGTITVNGKVLTTSGMIVLHTSRTSNNNSVFYNVTPESTSNGPYLVPAGKAFYLDAAECAQTEATNTTDHFQIVYATNNPGLNSATALTGAIGLLSQVASGNAADNIFNANFGSASSIKQKAIGGKATQNTWIHLAGGADGQCTLYGHEL